jgi:hypothetical protein
MHGLQLSEKASRGVIVGYPPNASSYRIYNPETRRITSSVHVIFQENTHGFGARLPVDSVIADTSAVDDPQKATTHLPPCRHSIPYLNPVHRPLNHS